MKISLEINEKQWRFLEAAAKHEGCSIEDFILTRVLPRDEDGLEGPSELHVCSTREVRARIEEALRSPALDGASATAELREELRVCSIAFSGKIGIQGRKPKVL